ncbi:MAG TPA: ATPase, T2SS/T4P/T4SS family, partial [Thermoanaerobaculia bacterium]|nr:ATPase, T2SS/T4P/T4SS family [Thermoanaerobaculia bacterium]
MARLHELFLHLKNHGASDLHLASGLEPRVRVHGELEAVPGWPVLDNEAMLGLLREIASDEQWEEYRRCGDLDFAYGFEGVARFRANYLEQSNGAGAVFRMIPEEIVPLEKLKLPKAIESLAHLQQGLVLVTGPTGSGKSTTLAALIDYINTTRAAHIMTVEDPIEYLHRDHHSIVNQREVAVDTRTFSHALRSALRQDPDVIL